MKRGTIEHPKMKRLARLLDCEHLLAVGIMESLWHWTARYAPAGDIGKHSDADIADGIGYRGDMSRLVATLADVGFLDRCAKHRYIVHDWPDHADDAVKKWAARNSVTLIAKAVTPSVETCPDNVETCPENGCLPEPLPEPQPLPLPEPVADQTSQPKRKRQSFVKPTLEDIQAYCQERSNYVDPQRFFDYYESCGWMVGSKPMKDWKASVRYWEANAKEEYEKKHPPKPSRIMTMEEAQNWSFD